MILSSIPGIGKLFSTTKKEEDRQELIIFIQPKIVNDDRSMAEAQEDMDFRYDSAAKVREMGAGPGVLPPRGSVAAGAASSTRSRSSNYAPTAVPVQDSGKKRRISGRPGSVFRGRR